MFGLRSAEPQAGRKDGEEGSGMPEREQQSLQADWSLVSLSSLATW